MTRDRDGVVARGVLQVCSWTIVCLSFGETIAGKHLAEDLGLVRRSITIGDYMRGTTMVETTSFTLGYSPNAFVSAAIGYLFAVLLLAWALLIPKMRGVWWPPICSLLVFFSSKFWDTRVLGLPILVSEVFLLLAGALLVQQIILSLKLLLRQDDEHLHP